MREDLAFCRDCMHYHVNHDLSFLWAEMTEERATDRFEEVKEACQAFGYACPEDGVYEDSNDRCDCCKVRGPHTLYAFWSPE